VKDILKKINDQLRRSGLTNGQLFSKVDLNGNGVVERSEFKQFFTKDLTVKNMSMEEIELVFEAVDMNKDGLLSVNEFCLCLEGVQQSFEQRIRAFDPDLEKSLKEEINTLFDFFDTNKDNKITIDELQLALKSQNPFITQHEIELIMKEGDRDLNKNLDRKEFADILLP
jgi:Ca2+-binding EF-hand superfamily protein